jgi:ankyrin repeat protein
MTHLHLVICFEKFEKSSIHGACTTANIDEVSKVVYDTNVNAVDTNGRTPLHVACLRGKVNIIQVLLSVFARVDITDDERQTPAEIANRCGNKDFVPFMSLLLDGSNYNPSLIAGATVSSTSDVTQATVDVIVSDDNVIAGDARSTL